MNTQNTNSCSSIPCAPTITYLSSRDGTLTRAISINFTDRTGCPGTQQKVNRTIFEDRFQAMLTEDDVQTLSGLSLNGHNIPEKIRRGMAFELDQSVRKAITIANTGSVPCANPHTFAILSRSDNEAVTSQTLMTSTRCPLSDRDNIFTATSLSDGTKRVVVGYASANPDWLQNDGVLGPSDAHTRGRRFSPMPQSVAPAPPSGMAGEVFSSPGYPDSWTADL